MVPTIAGHVCLKREEKDTSLSSNYRMSQREGLGPHVHLSGPTSYQEIQLNLEEKKGRPVSIGEVFIEIHTKPDGTYVDRKAERIAQTYNKNVEEKLAELEAEASIVSDGASQRRKLRVDEYTAIFLQSTEKDSRGTPYGIGSLKETLVNGKCKQPEDTSAFVAMQEQLKEAQQKIEEQVAYTKRRDAMDATREAKHSQTVAEQKNKLDNLSLVEKYLRQTDPDFLDFVASQSAASTTEPLVTTRTATSTPSAS